MGVRLSRHEMHRFFWGTQRGEVGVNGHQNSDGTVRERWINPGPEVELDSAAARERARALIAARPTRVRFRTFCSPYRFSYCPLYCSAYRNCYGLSRFGVSPASAASLGRGIYGRS
jgi:hypothetical protein